MEARDGHVPVGGWLVAGQENRNSVTNTYDTHLVSSLKLKFKQEDLSINSCVEI